VGSDSSFRLTVDFFDPTKPDDVAPLASPSLDPTRAMASFTKVSSNGMRGVKTAFGELLVADDGRWILKDASGKQVAAATEPPKLTTEQGADGMGAKRPGITMVVTGSKTGPGANGRRPCLVNGGWGSSNWYFHNDCTTRLYSSRLPATS
jgi:hypothetical protein